MGNKAERPDSITRAMERVERSLLKAGQRAAVNHDVVFTAPFEGAKIRASLSTREQIVSPKIAAPVLFYLNKSL